MILSRHSIVKPPYRWFNLRGDWLQFRAHALGSRRSTSECTRVVRDWARPVDVAGQLGVHLPHQVEQIAQHLQDVHPLRPQPSLGRLQALMQVASGRRVMGTKRGQKGENFWPETQMAYADWTYAIDFIGGPTPT